MVAKSYALFTMMVWSIMTGGASSSTVKTANVMATGRQTGVVSGIGDNQAFVEELDDIINDDDEDDEDDDDENYDVDDYYDNMETEDEVNEILKGVEWLTAADGGTIDEVWPFYQELFKMRKTVADDFDRNAFDFSALYSTWMEFVKAPWGTDQQLLMLAYYQRLLARYAADRERLQTDLDNLRDMETMLLPSTVYPGAKEITNEQMKMAFAMAEKDELMAAVESLPVMSRQDADGMQYNKNEERGLHKGERSLFPDTP